MHRKFLEGLSEERGRNEIHRIVNPNQKSNEEKSQDDTCSSIENDNFWVEQESRKDGKRTRRL